MIQHFSNHQLNKIYSREMRLVFEKPSIEGASAERKETKELKEQTKEITDLLPAVAKREKGRFDKYVNKTASENRSTLMATWLLKSGGASKIDKLNPAAHDIKNIDTFKQYMPEYKEALKVQTENLDKLRGDFENNVPNTDKLSLDKTKVEALNKEIFAIDKENIASPDIKKFVDRVKEQQKAVNAELSLNEQDETKIKQRDDLKAHLEGLNTYLTALKNYSEFNPDKIYLDGYQVKPGEKDPKKIKAVQENNLALGAARYEDATKILDADYLGFHSKNPAIRAVFMYLAYQRGPKAARDFLTSDYNIERYAGWRHEHNLSDSQLRTLKEKLAVAKEGEKEGAEKNFWVTKEALYRDIDNLTKTLSSSREEYEILEPLKSSTDDYKKRFNTIISESGLGDFGYGAWDAKRYEDQYKKGTDRILNLPPSEINRKDAWKIKRNLMDLSVRAKELQRDIRGDLTKHYGSKVDIKEEGVNLHELTNKVGAQKNLFELSEKALERKLDKAGLDVTEAYLNYSVYKQLGRIPLKEDIVYWEQNPQFALKYLPDLIDDSNRLKGPLLEGLKITQAEANADPEVADSRTVAFDTLKIIIEYFKKRSGIVRPVEEVPELSDRREMDVLKAMEKHRQEGGSLLDTIKEKLFEGETSDILLRAALLGGVAMWLWKQKKDSHPIIKRARGALRFGMIAVAGGVLAEEVFDLKLWSETTKPDMKGTRMEAFLKGEENEKTFEKAHENCVFELMNGGVPMHKVVEAYNNAMEGTGTKKQFLDLDMLGIDSWTIDKDPDKASKAMFETLERFFRKYAQEYKLKFPNEVPEANSHTGARILLEKTFDKTADKPKTKLDGTVYTFHDIFMQTITFPDQTDALRRANEKKDRKGLLKGKKGKKGEKGEETKEGAEEKEESLGDMLKKILEEEAGVGKMKEMFKKFKEGDYKSLVTDALKESGASEEDTVKDLNKLQEFLKQVDQYKDKNLGEAFKEELTKKVKEALEGAKK